MDICVSLEMAKRLKEAGWPQEEAEFSVTAPDGFDKPYDVLPTNLARDRQGWRDFTFAAPTAEEILRKLPPSITLNGKTAYLHISDDRDWVGDSSWDICYSHDRTLGGDAWVRNKDGFACACAKMWIYLSENKLLQ